MPRQRKRVAVCRIAVSQRDQDWGDTCRANYLRRTKAGSQGQVCLIMACSWISLCCDPVRPCKLICGGLTQRAEIEDLCCCSWGGGQRQPEDVQGNMFSSFAANATLQLYRLGEDAVNLSQVSASEHYTGTWIIRQVCQKQRNAVLGTGFSKQLPSPVSLRATTYAVRAAQQRTSTLNYKNIYSPEVALYEM